MLIDGEETEVTTAKIAAKPNEGRPRERKSMQKGTEVEAKTRGRSVERNVENAATTKTPRKKLKLSGS